MDYKTIFEGCVYYTLQDLRYNDQIGFKIKGSEIDALLNYKDELVESGKLGFSKLNLKTFNSKHIFYNNHKELIDLYNEYIDLINTNDIFTDNPEMVKSRIYSELEGSLCIEGIYSTRKIYDRLVAGGVPQNRNELIIKNMSLALSYVDSKPEFSKENLHKLYNILSCGCLEDDQMLKSGAYYRDDMVYISNYNGCPQDNVEPCMNSLFEFVGENMKTQDPILRFMLPHIVHYYILYIHPYFDYNGRTARMCSLWVAKLLGLQSDPFFISEAINDTKKKYYNAISTTRDSRNDLTYFLKYILEISIKYALCYNKIRKLEYNLADQGESLTASEQTYLKKIILSSEHKMFSWKDFASFLNYDISKQGALKILNNLEKLGLLYSKINERGEKQFKLM